MADTSTISTSPKGSRNWLKLFLKLGALFVVLVLVLYFVATSSFFLKSVILPRVSSTLNASVTAESASIHPFGEITLRDLKVQAAGKEPLFAVNEVHLRYHLWDIIGGNIHVDEIGVDSPTVELVVGPDGTSNLDPILKALQGKPAAEIPVAPSGGPAKPLKVDLAKLTVSNANIRQIINYPGGTRDVAEFTNVNVTLSNLKNGGTAKLELSAGIHVAKNPPNGPAGTLAASLKGNFDCALSPDLKPGTVNGGLNLAVVSAGGMFANLDAFGLALACDVTPTDIKQVGVRFQKAGEQLGELTVTGPFDAAKMEGKLNVALNGIDRRLLNLAGGPMGLDFGTTAISSSNDLELAKGGTVITASGKLNVDKLRVTRAGQTTPTLDFSVGYSVTADRAAQVATLNRLELSGTQNGTPLLDAHLSNPMGLPMGGTSTNLGDAALNLTLTNLSLADWKPFLGNAVTGGNLGVNLKVSSLQGGKHVAIDLSTVVAGLAARVGDKNISQAEVIVSMQAEAVQFQTANLNSLNLQLRLQNLPAVTITGSGTYDLTTGAADLQVKLQAALARLLSALPQPDANVSSGDVVLTAHVTQKQKAQTVTGDLALDNFSGQFGKNELRSFGNRLHFDVASSPEAVQINQVAGSFSQNGKSGGTFEVVGSYQVAQQAADVKVTLSDLNDNLLRPFLEPLLAGKKLASVSISGTISGQSSPKAGSAVKAGVQLSNLVVSDPAKKSPMEPLVAGLKVDASFSQQIADLRELQIALTPTARATNELQLSGRVDFSKTNVISGSLKLAADSLDFTRYYDLVAGGKNAGAKTPATTTPAPAGSDQEPPPVHLPLRDFTLAANIGAIYLHEIAITNFQMTTRIDDGHIVVKPFSLALNGAPVNSTVDVDLGVPGYKYDVGFSAKSIPLAPLVNTFQPDRAGQMGGTVTAGAQIAGAGTTGPNLKKNLSGQYGLEMTNLNLSVINVRNPLLRAVINVVAALPQLLKSPENMLGSLLNSATGQGGLMGNLEKSPLDYISVQGSAGGGQVALKQAIVRSAAFEVNAAGAIALNSVLTNSTIKIPVAVSLSQSLAQQLSLTSSNATANATYVPMPQFLTLTGTLGAPKADIDKVALAGATLKALGGNLFKSSGTNASPVGGLLNNLFKPKK